MNDTASDHRPRILADPDLISSPADSDLRQACTYMYMSGALGAAALGRGQPAISSGIGCASSSPPASDALQGMDAPDIGEAPTQATRI
jgi:hypothetical protein